MARTYISAGSAFSWRASAERAGWSSTSPLAPPSSDVLAQTLCFGEHDRSVAAWTASIADYCSPLPDTTTRCSSRTKPIGLASTEREYYYDNQGRAGQPSRRAQLHTVMQQGGPYMDMPL